MKIVFTELWDCHVYSVVTLGQIVEACMRQRNSHCIGTRGVRLLYSLWQL